MKYVLGLARTPLTGIRLVKNMKMVSLFQDVPQGYNTAVETLNTVPHGVLTEICHDVALFIGHKINVVPFDHYQKCLEDAGLSCDPKVLFNTVSYIFRTAVQAKVPAEKLVGELSSSMAWNESTLEAIRTVWNSHGKLLCSPSIIPTLQVGQLIDMKWKLSVGMSSSSCRSLSSPYVTVQITVADPSGNPTTKSFEMTVAEFKKFAGQMREISSVLETV